MNTRPPGDPPPVVTATHNSFPTLGSILGSVGGSVLVAKVGLDPVNGGAVIAGVTGLATALFHWLGSKIGVSL